MKIADFGLARDVHQIDYYRKTTDVSYNRFLVLLYTSERTEWSSILLCSHTTDFTKVRVFFRKYIIQKYDYRRNLNKKEKRESWVKQLKESERV